MTIHNNGSLIDHYDNTFMVIIVSFPIENGDFPVRYVSLPEGNHYNDHP